MLELLNFDRIEEILILIVPGFVSLKMWMLVNPTARLKLSDSGGVRLRTDHHRETPAVPRVSWKATAPLRICAGV